MRKHGMALAGPGRRLLSGQWVDEVFVCFEMFERESGRRLYVGLGAINLFQREDPEDPVRAWGRAGERAGGREGKEGRGNVVLCPPVKRVRALYLSLRFEAANLKCFRALPFLPPSPPPSFPPSFRYSPSCRPALLPLPALF
jgi:hypothetical protein